MVDMKKTRLKRRPAMLAILDGWGLSAQSYGNAVMAADTPNLDRIFQEHPHTSLSASGLAVGLPEGQMGNSEVGHLNIGAGRTVYQALTRITKSITDGDFFQNSALSAAMENGKKPGKALHIIGLVSDGGVHSHQDHLEALLRMARERGLSKVYIHAWLDGRDTPPRSADGFLAHLRGVTERVGTGEIATICGRYFAMDRDKRWDRVEQAYDAVTVGGGRRAYTAEEAIANAYAREENDEFVTPTNIFESGKEPVLIHSGDSVIFFNFRPDRARELTRCFVDSNFDGFVRSKILQDLVFVCMTEYDATMPRVLVAYPPEPIRNTLGEYLAGLGLTQLRIAETEKYAHVTFFFNGGEEEPNAGEERILIPSPRVATYDLKPEMSAFEVGARVVAEIESGSFDVIILNFANMDMVGHTGVMNAAIQAVEAVDTNIGKIEEAIKKVGGQLLITADHGNSDQMLTENGDPVTAHSTNPVPLILIAEGDEGFALKSDGALSDLAPTLLDLMELPIPTEMIGHSLLVRK